MVHFSAVKVTEGSEKNMSFLLIPKSWKVWKKSEAMGPFSFKTWFPINTYNYWQHLWYSIIADLPINPQAQLNHGSWYSSWIMLQTVSKWKFTIKPPQSHELHTLKVHVQIFSCVIFFFILRSIVQTAWFQILRE